MGRYRMLSRTNRWAEGPALRTAGTPVEPLLRRLKTLAEQAFNGVGRSADADREVVPVARGNAAEHEVGGILTPRRAADADPDAVEVLAPEGLGER